MESQAPSPETRQAQFEQGVALALNLWPDLAMAVRDSLGGPDSADKRDWLCGAVVELYPAFTASSIRQIENAAATQQQQQAQAAAAAAGSAPKTGDELDNSDMQEFLAGVMQDEFELILEEGDPSLWQVAEQIVRVRRDCAAGRFANVESLRARWEQQGGRGKSVHDLFKRGQDPNQDTDGDSSEDDDEEDEDGGVDIDMDEAPPLVRASREKPEPDVDEDGFTKVTKKKR